MKTILSLLIVTIITASAADLSGRDLLQQMSQKASGEFLVTDVVGKISSGLSGFKVSIGGVEVPIVTDSNVSFSGNALIAKEAKKGRSRKIGGTSGDVILQVGSSGTLLVSLSEGRPSTARIASDSDRLAAKMKSASSPQEVEMITQARSLEIEIKKLEAEIKSGVSGTGSVQTMNVSTGSFSSGQVTTRFTDAEIAEKKQLVALKKAQLAAMTQ